MSNFTHKYASKELIGHKNSITNVKFSPDQTYILSSSQDKTLRLWNPTLSSPLLKTYSDIHSQEILDFLILENNSKIISAGEDRDAFLIDSQTSKVLRRFRSHTSSINSLATNKEQTILVTGSNDMTVKIFDINNASVIQTLQDAKDSITSVCFINNLVISSSVDGFVRIYDIRKGELISFTFGVPINAIDASFDARLICVSCMNSTIQLYDTLNQDIVKEFCGNHTCRNYMLKVKFDPYDDGIFISSEDGKLSYYDFLDEEKNFYLQKNDKVLTCLDTKLVDRTKYCFVCGSSDSKILYYTEIK